MTERTRDHLREYYQQLMHSVDTNDGDARVKPYQVIVNVTMRCNSRCSYCDVWHKQTDSKSLDDWVLVLDDLQALGIGEFIISGGEPLLRDDLDVWIQKAADHGMYNVLITNGLLLTEKRINELISAKTHRITLSFDTFVDETFRLHRGIPIKPVLSALDALARALQSNPPRWFSVGINVVASMRNIDDIPDIVRYAAEHCMSVQIQVANPYPGLGVNHLLPTMEEMPKFREGLETLIKIKEEGYPINTSIEYLQYSPEYLESRRLPSDHHCLMSDVAVILDENFNLLPCWFLPATGNVLQTPIQELWNSEKMKQARQNMHIGKCPGCWLTCNADWEISFLGASK